MPIVNGQYVYQNLGSDQNNIQQQAFGPGWKPTKKDMSDYSAAAYNYMMKQQEQAYNLELWKLQNEYNSPAAQMQRYQDAGLNPNLIYGQQNTAASPAAASAPSFRSGGTFAKQQQNALSMIGMFADIVKQAKDIYDYAKYGAPERQLRNTDLFYQGALRKSQAGIQQLEDLWLNWLMGSPDSADYSDTLRGQSYRIGIAKSQASVDQTNAQIERIKALCDMIPDQQARTRALTALDEYRQKILQGQNDAILNISTGNQTLDSFIKAFIFFGISKF